MDYLYAMWSPLTQTFLPSKQEFRKYPMQEYSWNYLDHLICGYYDNMTEQVKYKRGHYCVLPPALAHLADDDDREAALQDYGDKFNRFLDYIRLKARGKDDKTESDATLLDVTPLLTKVQQAAKEEREAKARDAQKALQEAQEAGQTRQAVNGKPADTVDIEKDVKKGSSDKGKDSSAPKNPSGICKVQQNVAKIPLLAPDAPHSQQWVNLRYDMELLPTQCFHLEVQWLVCRSALVDDFITGLTRRAKQFSLDIIPVPENYGASTLDIHPLICPVHFAIHVPSVLPMVEKALVSTLGFCVDGIYTATKELLPTQYNVHKPTGDRNYRQYVHRELSCFVRVTDASVVWISSRRLHSPEMKALFETVRACVADLQATALPPLAIAATCAV
ncbi:hypothetical protein SPRG_11937 [Saprolegnia parasitica CBS 223.65]|uniref:Uncharacterized protein n=1 Tax=Saprolegnia parasitica (strain CBS 223.65) TaxID=695850 RepID=A0A067BXU5_SAPPC|nr:hypothetical protein SPRG_11937 [Saprolegnia parasitica CBS 223.65]KDO23093.1 hypothetical protein SPRG_11937 [Saprolegnia parasitica CBS 223.65]|eukprot:XP_012206204.1 hypothetical protein SPRG_11937 [Saprolegnia parasitica CBS 223.65]